MLHLIFLSNKPIFIQPSLLSQNQMYNLTPTNNNFVLGEIVVTKNCMYISENRITQVYEYKIFFIFHYKDIWYNYNLWTHKTT